MKEYRRWSEEEKNKLIFLFEKKGMTCKEIAIILERSISSVSIKTQKWGLKHTKEQTYKIKSKLTSGKNNPMYGVKAWSRGLTKEINKKLLKASKKLSKKKKEMFKKGLLPDLKGKNNPMFGANAWNKGLKKEIDKRLEEAGKKSSITKKKQYKKLPETEKDRIREHCARIGSRCKKKKTKIEIKIENFLKDNNIKYESNYCKGNFSFDFYLQKKDIVIECQGDYWHSNPKIYNKNNINSIQKKNIKRDKRKKIYLKENKIKNFFFWETDINRNFKMVEEQLLRGINE